MNPLRRGRLGHSPYETLTIHKKHLNKGFVIFQLLPHLFDGRETQLTKFGELREFFIQFTGNGLQPRLDVANSVIEEVKLIGLSPLGRQREHCPEAFFLVRNSLLKVLVLPYQSHRLPSPAANRADMAERAAAASESWASWATL